VIFHAACSTFRVSLTVSDLIIIGSSYGGGYGSRYGSSYGSSYGGMGGYGGELKFSFFCSHKLKTNQQAMVCLDMEVATDPEWVVMEVNIIENRHWTCIYHH